ncbi:matrix-remodeling-associated protein 7 isoform X1 [Arapaima gigas]
MDVVLDASFVLPALFFTFLAVILASSLLSRKRAPRCDAGPADEAPAEGRTGQDCVPPQDEALQAADQVKGEAEAVAGGGPEEEPGTPEVEDVGAAEEGPLNGAEIQEPLDNSAPQETILKPVSAPTPKEEPTPEPMLASVPGRPPSPENEVNTEPIPTASPEPAPLSEPAPAATPKSQNLNEDLLKSTSEPSSEQLSKSSQLPIQEMPAESSPVKEAVVTNDNAAAPSSQEEEEALKYVPGKLRTSQLEKLMTKEELEEEQRVQREQLAAIFQLLRDNKDTFGEVTEADVEEQLKLYSV